MYLLYLSGIWVIWSMRSRWLLMTMLSVKWLLSTISTGDLKILHTADLAICPGRVCASEVLPMLPPIPDWRLSALIRLRRGECFGGVMNTPKLPVGLENCLNRLGYSAAMMTVDMTLSNHVSLRITMCLMRLRCWVWMMTRRFATSATLCFPVFRLVLKRRVFRQQRGFIS